MSSGSRILVIEDNETNRKLFEALLQACGCPDVVMAVDGEEGIAMARECNPDLIIMDIQLPNLSGLDATRILKADDRTRAIPVVAVTAFAMPGDEKKVLESGCDAYLSKPVSMTSFIATLKKFLEPESGAC